MSLSELSFLRWMSSTLRRTPSVLLLLVLMGLYALTVGPLHLFAMRKLKRPLLAVVTIPAVAFAFVGIIFLCGLVMRGTSTVGQQLNLFVSVSGDPVAREHVLFVLHSASDREFDVSAPVGTWLEPVGMSEGNFDRTLTGMHLELGSGTVLRDVPVAQWQTRMFAAERAAAVGGGVSFSVDEGAVSIVNNSPFSIRSAVLLKGGLGASTMPIGPVAPGSTQSQLRRGSGFDPLRDLGLTEEDLVGRSIAEWIKQTNWENYAGAPILVCVLDPGAEVVQTDVSRRESGGVWIVFSKEAAP